MNKTVINLENVRDEYGKIFALQKRRVVICAGTGCVANGALDVYDALVAEIEKAGLSVNVDLKEETPSDVLASKSGCQGFCQVGPLLTIEPEGLHYIKVKPEDVKDIVEQTLVGGKPVERLLYVCPTTGKKYMGTADIPFYAQQKRFVLDDCGRVDPEDINEYIWRDGYFAARKAYTEMQPGEICDEMIASCLKGRGGGGFPTGRKWALTLPQPGEKKYVICNGDEGDPGAFMDRSLMEGNPHRVLEGMMIAARAIGADEGYVYVRAEYPLAVDRMRKAIEDAEKAGILGENILGTEYNLKLHIKEGAGAFVCGEETALIASIEGKRGMPKSKPPFPAEKGLWDKPTVINNVETLATVPLIILMGADKYKEMGTELSPGTKTFAVTGHVANAGLIEVPFGVTARKVVYDIGGGVTDKSGKVIDDGFKAVQVGGPSGGCLTADHLDLPLDFDSLKSIGAMVGSGGLVVMNKHTCMVQIAHFFMQFTQNESCGKCVPCREGTKQMLALLDDIIEGKADEGTLELLEKLAKAVRGGSLCGLGKTAPNPVLTTMEHFKEEYIQHVIHKRCPAGQCKALAVPEIIAEKCKGCTLCARKCPVDAITGERKKPFVIDVEKCVKCGICAQACKFDAIVGV